MKAQPKEGIDGNMTNYKYNQGSVLKSGEISIDLTAESLLLSRLGPNRVIDLLQKQRKVLNKY